MDDRIDETGTLIRDGGAFYLRRDAGGCYELALQRTPVDQVEKRVRLIGRLIGSDRVEAEGVAPLGTPQPDDQSRPGFGARSG